MGGSLGQLTSRQLERLKSELAEVIIANFCYPAFLDYRLNTLRTRPVDRRKRQEVWAYVNSVNFHPLGTMDAASMDFRRFVERIFLRYIDMNRALAVKASTRQVATVRARVPQLAVSVARGLADYLALSEASIFGRSRMVESWSAAQEGSHELTWEQIEKSTQVLQTTLVYLRTTGVEKPTAVDTGRARIDQAALADISDFPTRVLSPANAEPRLASAGATNGGTPSSHHAASLAHAADNGTRNVVEERISFSPLPVGDEPGAQGQFRGPRRSPTASRPIERESAVPPAAPTGGESIEPNVPPLPIQPAPAPQPSLASQSGGLPDAWQALLSQRNADQPAAPPDVNAWSAVPEQPEAHLPDLPESFGAPRLLDLPPDLAELYGDYLHDARSANLHLAPSVQEASASEGQPETHAAPLPPSETDEEVDALFNALTSHIAAQEKTARAASPPERVGSADPADSTPAGPVLQTQSRPLDSAPEGADASHMKAPLSGQSSGLRDTGAEAQRSPAASAKAVPDGDVMIFAQLQHQISTWVKMAAISHQIDLAGRDAAALVAELRRTAALEEAELQVIESLVALCHRVTSTKQATMEDYKQAMMLYLLHHRSRLAL